MHPAGSFHLSVKISPAIFYCFVPVVLPTFVFADLFLPLSLLNTVLALLQNLLDNVLTVSRQ